MELLYLLEGIRTPLLDGFFSLVTHLGSEVLFMAIAIAVFWCVNKRQGIYLLTVGFFSTLINQFLKIVCRIPRPWVRDPDFTIVEAARADAGGYSFPSGHTASVTAALGCPARASKNKWLRASCIVLIALVGFSRMYLGVHTPADVGVSLVIGVILIFALYPIFSRSEESPRRVTAVIAVLTALSLAFCLYTQFAVWPVDIDADNLFEARKNACLLFACGLAMLISLSVERKYINFSVEAPLWAQFIKVIAGLALIMLIKEGLKPVLALISDSAMLSTLIRYFLMVVFAVCVWPLTFRWFSDGCPLGKRRS